MSIFTDDERKEMEAGKTEPASWNTPLHELSEEQRQHLAVGKLQPTSDGSHQVATLLLKTGDGGQVEIDVTDLSAAFARMSVIQGCTFSYSRKLNSENHYQKFAGEDFFHSASVDFSAIWRAFPPELAAHPEVGRVMRRAFEEAFLQMVGRTLRNIYTLVLREVEGRARQLKLKSHPYIAEELAQINHPQFDAFDPVGILPAPPSLPEGWKQFWSQDAGRPYYVNEITKESVWDVPTEPAKAPETAQASA